ncbi:hypothetical protein [Parahaliea mediterranea]|uniref:hypothetical protein n=1 Tax=Parahaliea mediterranea TaxID=651086 RepID=UPI001300A0E5|nr:hypothetical protein [Parahaliea mediterranea]
MKPGFSLPEKEYFSRDELAERWGCGRDLVDYYIRHGLLREAMYTHQPTYFPIQVCDYFLIDASSPMFERHRHDVFNFCTFTELAEVYDVEVTSSDIVQCPKFAYVGDPCAFFTDQEPGPFTQGQLLDGYEPEWVQRFVFLQGFGSERYIPVTRSDSGEWIFKTVFVDGEMGEDLIVPREERDRFEAGLPIGSGSFSKAENIASEPDITRTTENGYLVTIGLLARLLSNTDDKFLKSDGSVNIRALSIELEKLSMSLDGHRFEALKKRISAGLNTLKEIS